MDLTANTLVISVSVLLSGIGISVTVGMWAGRMKSIVESLQSEVQDLRECKNRHDSSIGHIKQDIAALKSRNGLDNGTPGTASAPEH